MLAALLFLLYPTLLIVASMILAGGETAPVLIPVGLLAGWLYLVAREHGGSGHAHPS